MPTPGQTICGQYEVLRYAADGLGCSVFGGAVVARDAANQQFWLTSVPRNFLPTPVKISEFMAGANGLMQLRHPGLVRVGAVDREQSYAIVGYEFLPSARCLATLRGKKIKADAVLRRGEQLARGLAHLHEQGQVHGLVGLGTVLSWEGQTLLWQHGVAHLCERGPFGHALRRQPDTELFAPEMTAGQEPTPATDIYGWAAVVAQLATGLVGVEAVAAVLDGDVELGLGPAMSELLQRCLQARAGLRPVDGTELLAEMDVAGAPRGVAAQATPPPRIPDDAHLPSALGLSERVPTPAPMPPSAGVPLSDPDMFGGLDVTEEVKLLRDPPATAASKGPSELSQAASLDHLVSAQLGDMVGATSEGATPMPQSEPPLLELAGAAESHSVDALAPPVPEPPVAVPPGSSDSGERRRGLGHEAPTLTDGRIPGPSPFRLPRPPGPHGPRTGWMAWSLAILAPAIVGLSTLHVADQKGGAGPLMSSLRPQAVAEVGGRGVARRVDSQAEGAGTESTGTDGEESPEANPPKNTKVEKAKPPKPPSACPEGTVPVSDKVCIDAYEFPGFRRAPEVDVTWRDASKRCDERKMRLCSGAEWKSACAGPQGLRYGYAAQPETDRCNTASVAGFASEIAYAGAYSRCRSAAGAFDMLGNVGEWVAEGMVVGGDSSTFINEASCRARGRPPKGYHGQDVGFRCCVDR